MIEPLSEQDANSQVIVARWVSDLAPGQCVTCDFGRDDSDWYGWGLVQNREIVEHVEVSHQGFCAIGDWLDEQERVGAISAIACDTYVRRLQPLVPAHSITR